MIIQLPLFSSLPDDVAIPDDVPRSNKHLVKPGYRFRQYIPETDDCIIFDQFYYVDIRGAGHNLWYALVQCPRCSKIFIKRRSAMHRKKTSRCEHCALSVTKPLPVSDECIIITPLVLFASRPTAIVECPLCHKQYRKLRSNIFKDKHTICFPCASHRANSGPNHYLWKGGASKNYYYGCDWVYLSACVRARDNYRCQYPDCAETRYTQHRALSVHHIVPFNDSHDNSPQNLISLCQAHHKWADHRLPESVPMFENMIMMMYGPGYR